MFNGLLNFSFKEIVSGIVLSVVLIGGGVAAIVAFVPRSAGGEVAPPVPPVIAPPVVTESPTVTIPVPPIVPETTTVSVPAEPIQAQPDLFSLVAESFTVSVGASSATWLNPLLYVYDTGEQGTIGVDVDRDTLQIVSVSAVSGTAEITSDGRAVLYTPASDADLSDSLAYTVQTTAQGIFKVASATVAVNLQGEKFAENLTELNSLLQRHFDADTDASVRANFRFRDGQVTNQDLEIVRYFAEQNFSDDSVQLIMDLSEPLSPLRDLDQYSLTKLNSIEKSLYQNPVFINNPHGTANWPPEYAKIMKQASFIIPSRIAVVDGLKHIYYDKRVIDELFQQLGGEYTGIFSKGQNYTPFWVALEDATQEQIDYYDKFSETYFGHSGEHGYFDEYVFDGGKNYYNTITNPKFHWNELTINFSILATLDSVSYTLGDELIDRSDTELFFLFDDPSEFEKQILLGPAGTFGNYGYIIPWEVGIYNNEEANNLYNLARNIIGQSVESELEGVFRLFDWLSSEKLHEGGRPYFPNHIWSSTDEENILNKLPNNAFFPAAYNLIEEAKGGISFSNSFQMAGHITAGLRSLGVSSEQFAARALSTNSKFRSEYLEPFVKSDSMGSQSYNIGLILIDDTPWFYNGNAGLVRPENGAYNHLIPQENFTVENLRKVRRGELDHGEYFYNNTALQAEYESLITTQN